MPTKTTAKKRVTKKRAVVQKKVVKKKSPAPKVLGKVVHYYNRIGVAIVELIAPITVGQTVTFATSVHGFDQHIESMQLHHAQVDKAKKGDIVGIRVDRRVRTGALVVPKKT